MLRLKIIKQLEAESKALEKEKQSPLPESGERRSDKRHDVSSKKLTLVHEREITTINNLSAKGFSLKVSSEGLKRLKINQVYSCFMRYHERTLEFAARVIWVSANKNVVGFQLLEEYPEVGKLFQEISQPFQIGSSLDATPNLEKENLAWYQGIHNTHLLIWYDEFQDICAWLFSNNKHYLSWDSQSQLREGDLKEDFFTLKPDQVKKLHQKGHAVQKKDAFLAYCIDVFSASEVQGKDVLIEHIMDLL